MNSKKKIEVNSSSLVGLKAELFRKQEALRRERLQQNSSTVKAKPVTKKATFWNKKNAGVQSRSEKDKSSFLDEEDTNKLDKSRAMLEKKAQLYDQMSKGVCLTEDDTGQFLVDFEKKAIDKIEEKRQTELAKTSKENGEDKETEYKLGDTDVPGPVEPGQEWVDYVDTLGRSRRCMKKDLPELISMDKRLNPQAFKEKEEELKSKDISPELLSNDMYRETMRKKWEAEEEELRQRDPGSVHYQNLRFDEVRDMGVGYFGFSKDERERQQQMEMLQHLRDKTVDQRNKSVQLKAKRKAALQARLEKIKQRKRLNGEFVGEDNVDDEEEKEKEDEKNQEEELSRRRRDEELKMTADRINKTAPVRDWDVGKDEPKWATVMRRAREERPREFAPPPMYNGGMNLPPTYSEVEMSGMPSVDRQPDRPPTGESGSRTTNEDTISEALSFFRKNTNR